MNTNTKKDETTFVHSGKLNMPKDGYISVPIVQSSTFYRQSPLQCQEYEYSRASNPTRNSLEDCIAQLENGKHGFCFSSGVAAIHSVCSLLKSRDEIIFQEKSYLGSNRIFDFLENQYGVIVKKIDFSNIDFVIKKISRNTKMIWIETPSNPLLEIVNLILMTKYVKRRAAFLNTRILIIVDNTFATPFYQKPLELGADIVVHSASKYLGGHSDAILGALACNCDKLAKRIKFFQNAFGAIPSPMEAFLVHRGIKTLHIRMEKHNENSKLIASFLKSNPKIQKVYHPSLDKKNKTIIKNQMSGFGGIVSFSFKIDTIENAVNFLGNLELIKVAESLGGVESLATNPASTSHKGIKKNEREKLGISDSLIRLSIGIEHPFDLTQELERALDSCL